MRCVFRRNRPGILIDAGHLIRRKLGVAITRKSRCRLTTADLLFRQWPEPAPWTVVVDDGIAKTEPLSHNLKHSQHGHTDQNHIPVFKRMGPRWSLLTTTRSDYCCP